jgi:glucose-6-phosphate 1-dehydrogenase
VEKTLPIPSLNQKPKNIPTVFIVYGATGDLMGKKIVPALFHLYKKGKFPKLFKIIGFSRRELNEDEFVKYVRELLIKHFKNGINKEELESFLKYFSFQQGDFEKIDSYKVLAKRLGIIDNGWNVCSNKLFYLAVPPKYYKSISEHLASSGLTIPCGADEGWTRVIVEKPFGRNLKSAEDLDTLLAKLFKEEQIYRIDHYLAKEMLQNILAFRFGNNLFEDIWNNKFIEKIEILTRESVGAEGRGAFYDGIGALRDVGQNHLLQMLALVTMDNPGILDSAHVRKKRFELLEALEPLSKEEIDTQTFRGQYKGYRNIGGVSGDSKVETYFKVIAKVNNTRWSGVDITLEAGKRLPLKKEIVVTFKHPVPCVCPPGKPHFTNRVIFTLEPREGIVIEFWSKKPGLDYKFVKRKLNFVNRRVTERLQYVEEYEKLLLDCISGNQILFLSTPEISSCWKYIDPIIHAWEKNEVPLSFYKPDSRQAINASNFVGQIEFDSKIKKELGIIGLGKMGGNLARQLSGKGWHVVGYNRTSETTKNLESEGIDGAYSLEEFVSKLKKPRIIITILTAGKPTDEIIKKLSKILAKNDTVAEFSNSQYKDSQKRAKLLEKSGINFIDVGISGGPGGALNGACLMVGGSKKTFLGVEPLLKAISSPGAVEHFEGVGAGHFVKMIHNGIEYGMMQSIAEGFEILKKSPFKLNLLDIARVYNNGSVVESRLTQWLEQGFREFGTDLDKVSSWVPRGGEGDWTIKAAKEENVPAKVIEDSVKARINSEKDGRFQDKVLNAMRNQFGGHSTQRGKKT